MKRLILFLSTIATWLLLFSCQLFCQQVGDVPIYRTPTTTLPGKIDSSSMKTGGVVSRNIKDSTIRRIDVHKSFKAPYADTADVALSGGGGGTTNHAALSNLGYSASGHSGFEASISTSSASKFFSWDKTWRDLDWSLITNKPSMGDSNHANLTNLSYATAGHTGFEPTISTLAINRGGTNNVGYNDLEFLWFDSDTGMIIGSGFNEYSFAATGHNHSGVYEPVFSTLTINKGGTNNTGYDDHQFLWFDSDTGMIIGSGYNEMSFPKFIWSLTGQPLKQDSIRFIQGSNVILTQTDNTLTIAAPSGSDSVRAAFISDTAKNVRDGSITDIDVSDTAKINLTKIAYPVPNLWLYWGNNEWAGIPIVDEGTEYLRNKNGVLDFTTVQMSDSAGVAIFADSAGKADSSRISDTTNHVDWSGVENTSTATADFGQVNIDIPDDRIGLTINSYSEQTADIMQWKNFNGDIAGGITYLGQGTFGGEFHANTNHGLDVYGEIVALPGMASPDFQIWKDLVPSRAVAFGMSKPGVAIGNDFVISTFDSSNWYERFRVLNTNGDMIIGGGLTLNSGSITDTSGTIDFDNENLTTTGEIRTDSLFRDKYGLVRPYKVYVALVKCLGGENNPDATILENTLSGTPVWTRSSAATYRLTLTDEFTENKTITFITPAAQDFSSPTTSLLSWRRDDDDFVTFESWEVDGGVFYRADWIAENYPFSIEVRVYE